MIQLYKKGNNNFSDNGDLVIQPISNKGKFVINDEITYEFECFYDEEGRWKQIAIDDIITAPTPWSSKQPYRIYNIVKDMDSMTLYTRHIFFDLNNYILLDKRPTNLTCKQALNYILEDTPYTGDSDIVTANTSYFVRKNIIEAINGNDENSIINRWGGEILPDNFTVNINKKLGGDYGVNITLGKNLKSIEEDINLDDVVTRIIPEGYDGIMLDGDTPWVDSPLINKYSQVRQKVIKFDDIKVKSNADDEEGYDTLAQAQTAMIERCNTLFEGGLDKPTVNYKVEMYLLRDTEEYKDFAILEDVSIGDTVHCKHEDIGIECDARCISLEWHVEQGEKIIYDTIELGTPEQNFFESTNDISNKVSNILNKSGNVKGDCLQGLIDASKASIQASRQVAELQSYRVGMCQDLDPSSDTYGATMWGTKGFFCSDTRDSNNKDWEWTTAITAKGIVANAIKTGILTAVKISNTDGSFYIDLSKSNGITFQNDEKDAIKIQNNKMIFYNLDGTSPIATISSEDVTASSTSETSKRLNIQTAANSMISIYGTGSSGKSIPLIMLDANKFFSDFAIIVQKRALFWDGIGVTGGIELQSGDLTVGGNLTVNGTKNRAIKTDNYGTRLLNAYETSECYFGDIGEAVIGEDGKVKIDMDNIFLETVNTKLPYQVFITKYGKGDCWVSERTETYFIIEGTPNLQVGYEIKAKQIDYTTNRLEEFKERRI